MSPKPAEPSRAVNVGRALETLRRERPTPEQTEDLLARLHRPHSRRSVARPLALAMTATALALALVFPPRVRSNSAWAQTLAATLGAPNSHAIIRQPGWDVREEWRSGARRAYRWLDKQGAPATEMRSDGNRRMRVYRGRSLSRPNWHAYAILDKPFAMPKDVDLPFTELDELLKQPNLLVLAHQESSDGKPEVYRFRVTKPIEAEYVAEIDPAARRIKRLLMPQSGATETFDYPETIPDRIFDPTPPEGVEVYDVAAQNALIARRQEIGLGRSGPVELRLVALDGDGRLWVTWTGGLDHLAPMGVSGPIRLLGVPSSKPQGTELTYSNWRKLPKDAKGSTSFQGEPVGRTMVVPRAEIGSTVSLEIPYPGGVARFPQAPVLRIGRLFDYALTFGDAPPTLKRRP